MNCVREGIKSIFMFVDFQVIFSQNHEWNVPNFYDALEKALIAHQEIRMLERTCDDFITIATQYVPPLWPYEDVWCEYFDKYPSIPKSRFDKAYELDSSLHGFKSIKCPKFGKWSSLNESCDRVFITGVSTDCCVLSTALSAVDNGVKVYIISDACAAGTQEDHDNALRLMSGFSPNITIITVDEIKHLF